MENKVFVIKTFQDNEVPASFDGAKIYIVGQDIVIKTPAGDTYEYPFAAQFLSMSKDVFRLKFADGTTISSKDLINYIEKNEFDIDGSLNKNQAKEEKAASAETQDDSAENAESDVTPEQPAPPKVITKIVKVQEVIVKDQDDSSTATASNKKFEAPINDFTGLGDYTVDGAREKPIVISSSGTPPRPENEPMIIVEKEKVATSKQFDMNTYQLGNDVNNQKHTAQVGGSRTDGTYETQYGKQTLDLSNSSQSWSVDGELNGWNYDTGSVTRIISVDNVDVLTDVKFRSKMGDDYKIIKAGTPEGNALNLKPNEFAVVYPGKDGSFSVDIEYNQGTGDAAGEKKGTLDFVVSGDPDKITNDNGSVNLGYSPTPSVIKLGQGDDTLKAGVGSDTYDGGGGKNSLDYSSSKTHIEVDLTQDVTQAFNDIGVQAQDGGMVTLGNGHTQSINNFETIVGSNHGDTFTLNNKGHTIKGGSGDDTYVMGGGSNTLYGNGGSNTLDYHKAGMDSAYNSLTLVGRDTDLDINGITLNFTQGKTIHNGFDSGQDTFSNIHHVIGSSKNDYLILGDQAVRVTERQGENYIQAGKGQYVIDGGVDTTILDYSKLTNKIDVNLNTGKVDKGDVKDSLTNVHYVIGSEGGTNFTGKMGGENTLVGVSGKNSFKVTNGNNQLYGGDQTNTYELDTGVSTIHAKGSHNKVTVNNSILTYLGSSGTGNNAKNSDFINELDYTGGIVHYTAGNGKSTNKITAHNGGTINLVAKGDTTFTSLNGGTNTVHLAEGTLDFSAEKGGDNTITTASNTELTLHGGKASHSVTLAAQSTMALDYSRDLDGEHNAVINLDGNRNINIDDGTYIDLIGGEGLVNKISGLKGGNTDITLSQSRQEDMTINLFNENNTVKVGKGLVDINIDKASQSNKVDYRHVDAQLKFDLSASHGNLVRDGQTQESLKNVSYIIGNDHNDNVYKGTDKYDVTFETGAGTGNKVIETQGNHTYKAQGSELTLDSSELGQGIQFEYDGTNGTVIKGDYTSHIEGKEGDSSNRITEVIGTDYDDTFTLDFGTDTLTNQAEFSVLTGGGNNTVNLQHQGYFKINSGSQSKPNSAYNTLNINYQHLEGTTDVLQFGDNGQSGTLHSENSQTQAQGTQQSTDFNYIDKINYKGDNELKVNWGNAAQGVNLSVNNGEHNTYLYVNGGGNNLDGGLKAGVEKTVLVSYQANTDTGIRYDATKGDMVSFADGRQQDTVKNFNVLQGSDKDDIITLKEGLTLLSSKGNDTLTANGATYQVSDEETSVSANFETGSINKLKDNVSVGTDTLLGEGVAKFINGNNVVYANIHSSQTRDMSFELVGGTVDFYSHVNTNNQIDTGNATLALHYEGLDQGIQVNIGKDGKNEVIKGDEGSQKTDSFTQANEIRGTDYGDTYRFEGSINQSKNLKITGGKGVDQYTFNGVNTSSLVVNAGTNTDTALSETFNFKGKNSNLTIKTKNANNIFDFDDTTLSNTNIDITSVGGNSFSLNNVNRSGDSSGKNNIRVTSTADRVNKFDFTGINKNIDINLSGGKNELNFKAGDHTDITVSANETSTNTLSVVDAQMGNVTYNSGSGRDDVNLKNVNKDSTLSNKFVINADSGENVTATGDGNKFTVTGDNKHITINVGEKDDTFDFSNSTSNDFVSINSLGGNNTFKMSGSFTNSVVTSKGNGNDTFSFDGVNVNGGSAANKLTVIASAGNNTFNFSGENHWIDVTGGLGDDTFNFNAGGNNSNVNVNGVSGNNQYNIYDVNSMPSRIDGGNGVDILTFKGQEVDDKEIFYYINNQTSQINKFEFNNLNEDQKIVLDFSQINKLYDNSDNTIHIDVGSKDNIDLQNSEGWQYTTNTDGSDTYSHALYGDVHINYTDNSSSGTVH
ncbi:beta strand repeat-containing protein [Providencia rettgeri]